MIKSTHFPVGARYEQGQQKDPEQRPRSGRSDQHRRLDNSVEEADAKGYSHDDESVEHSDGFDGVQLMSILQSFEIRDGA